MSECISLDLIPDPFAIIQTDGTLFDINLSFATLLGTSKHDLIGRDFNDIALLKTLAGKVSQSLASGAQDVERAVFKNRHFEILILPFRTPVGDHLVRIVLKDVTNFIRLEKELLKRNKELIVINALSGAFISSENMDMVMGDLLDKVLLITDFHAGWIQLKEDDCFRLKISRGISSEFQRSLSSGSLADLCADALKIKEPQYLTESSVISKIPALQEEGIAFLFVIPILSNHQNSGFLFLAGRVGREFDGDFSALLSLVGNHVSHIIDKIRLFQETRRLSITDGLTGLYNNRYFYKYLDLEVARTRRYGNTFSLMLFDIDDFKKLNDSHGHQAGDEVLQELAHLLKSATRETDIVVRYGGEEFIIILPSTSEEEAIALGNRIRHEVQEMQFRISDTVNVTITLSGGIASFPQNAASARTLVRAADKALYAAKTAGKNAVVCFKGRIDEESF